MKWPVIREVETEPFGYDPAYQVFSEKFSEYAARNGYRSRQLMSRNVMPVANNIVERFRKSESQQFPLLQIGHGIFTCNMGPEYDWQTFRSLIIEWLKICLDSYPNTVISRIIPNYLELRYIDSFDYNLLGHSSVERFIEERTNISYSGLDFLKSEKFSGEGKDRLYFRRLVTEEKNSSFEVDIVSGRGNDMTTVLMTNKVIGNFPQSYLGKSEKAIVNRVEKWIEMAHSLTHEFFESFVTPELIDRFKGDDDA